MEVAQKFLDFLDMIFVTLKITTRDLYVIPCSNIKEFIVLAMMISALSITATILRLPAFLDYRGCLIGVLILSIVYMFTKKDKQKQQKS